MPQSYDTNSDSNSSLRRKILSSTSEALACLSLTQPLPNPQSHRPPLKGPANAVQPRGDILVSASGDDTAKMWNQMPA
ncbi:hypothetical protein BU16DRAFT_557429 [Lophium mytilinum]|uniref:WD40 repeat-like protein n=1 Tax=Lophium mytilinum TaxID=390894 RepID=A0A6A6R3M5_9PEZI|nr:hypothetical protein BU16DRAFT_557429 [Lophium mytilinum]